MILLISAAAACSRSNDANESQPANQSAAQTSTAVTPSNRPAAFGMCAACHSDEAGRNGLGPSLHGVVGRQAGGVAGFAYSPAMKASGIVWDEAEIDRFIEDPRALVPGTKMTYAGLRDPARRAEITAYLATLK
jgi:cytochrome c